MDYQSKTWKELFLISAIMLSLAILFHGLLVHGSSNTTQQIVVNQTTPNEDGTFIVSTKNAPVWGKKDAPVTIIEFSDFDCPFCTKAYNQILPELKKDFIDTGKLRFIYRNAPLEIHTNAKTKATAALCVQALKGDEAFYSYHNQLYENTENKQPVNELLTNLAKNEKVNPNELSKCLKDNQTVLDQIELDIADSYQLGANGTPTWFIGKTNEKGDMIKGIRVVGTQPYSVYRILINQLLET